MRDNPDISIVVPVYNEEDNLPRLVEEIVAALARTGKEWEALFVDDGSTDASLDVLRRLAADVPQVRFVSFRENRGQSAAFCAGFDEARAPMVVTMDADLQNDPADIPSMLALYAQGYDMVIGWRRKRRDVWIKRIGSKVANWVRNGLTRESVHDTGCSLKIMNTAMLRCLPRFTGMHRFLPTLMKMQGARVAEIKVNHRERHRGQSKYGTLDRALAGTYDLFGVRWLQSRAFDYDFKERGE